MGQMMFISYSHKDKESVKKFVLQLSLRGVDFWLDEKNIDGGCNFTTDILSAIHKAKYYLVFISSTSITSNWVKEELDFALKRKIEGNLRIVPIILEDVELPIAISHLDYIDAQPSIIAAVDKVIELCGKHSELSSTNNGMILSSVSFTISDKTDLEIGGPYIEGVSIEDLDKCKEELLIDMRKHAYGILMNFVDAEDFDFREDVPRFKNGFYEESVRRVSGSGMGSVRDAVIIEVSVLKPNPEKVKKVLHERLKIMKVNAVSYGFSLENRTASEFDDIRKKAFKRLQDKHIILSYDNIDGAKIEVSEGFFLEILFSNNVIKVKLSSTWRYNFAEEFQKFSISDFIKEFVEY